MLFFYLSYRLSVVANGYPKLFRRNLRNVLCIYGKNKECLIGAVLSVITLAIYTSFVCRTSVQIADEFCRHSADIKLCRYSADILHTILQIICR